MNNNREHRVPSVGHNNPPPDEPTLFDLAAKAVNDIYDETMLWLDGKAIDNPEMADGVANLLAMIRKAEKEAEDAQADERRPHNKALSEISARYHPLIGDTKAGKGKTVRATAACKAALQPWLNAEHNRLAAEAEAKRLEADRQRAEAEAALRASDATNLAEREAAEERLQDARRADTEARAAERVTATAGGVMGRAIGLRTTWRAEITDEIEAARSMWRDSQGRQEIMVVLLEWANRKVRNERARSIPGFHISEDRNVA